MKGQKWLKGTRYIDLHLVISKILNYQSVSLIKDIDVFSTKVINFYFFYSQFKRYVNKLRSKSTVYKKKRQEVSQKETIPCMLTLYMLSYAFLGSFLNRMTFGYNIDCNLIQEEVVLIFFCSNILLVNWTASGIWCSFTLGGNFKRPWRTT